MALISIENLNDRQKHTLSEAVRALDYAYCPYSNYAVGAALMSLDGNVYIGANVENIAFGSTICAERSALVHANAHGVREFVYLAIIAKHLKIEESGIVTPCGACRQMLWEFSGQIGKELIVIMSSFDTLQIEISTMEELYPMGYKASNLGQAGS